MLPLLMPVDTWDTINTLVFNRKVLMVGVADGADAIALAQTAMVLAIYVDTDGLDVSLHMHKVQDVATLLVQHELNSRVLLHSVCALLGITQYAEGQFDVVVYNPSACRDNDPGHTAAMLANYAKRIVVVGDAIPDLWDVITHALPPGQYTASSDHSAIFVTMGAPEPIVRTD